MLVSRYRGPSFHNPVKRKMIVILSFEMKSAMGFTAKPTQRTMYECKKTDLAMRKVAGRNLRERLPPCCGSEETSLAADDSLQHN